MRLNRLFVIAVLFLLAATAVGCGILQEPEAASEPIEAIPLELEPTTPPAEAPTALPPTEAPAATEEPAAAEPTEEPTAVPTTEPTPEEPAGQGLLIYQIVPGESEVRFELDEDLRGVRTTVVGITDQVAGELAGDLNDLASTQIGTIQINARTLATDNEFRNRAIKNEILNTNDFEFITFAPTSIDGLPDKTAEGETVSFTITGDLTIRDVSNEVTFVVEATAVSPGEIRGTAVATVMRDSYNLTIPSVQNVANVEEEVTLTINFVARAAEADSSGAAMAEPDTAAAALQIAEDDILGAYLTDGQGMTLYTFSNDQPGISNCYDQCATAWPPLLVAEGEEITAAAGIPGEIGTTTRDDGTIQVTYDGWPLYYWVNDAAPGDTTGHNVRNVWAVARPTTKLLLGGNERYGRFLTGPNGMTLYRYNLDQPGMSACYDQCALNWPPLLLEDGEALTGGAGVVGELSTIARDDGTTQITYGGMPLYYWVKDAVPGDATGHNVDANWFVIPSYTVGLSSNDELGDFLVDNQGMTLYLFENDEPGTSTCYDQCAANWPPLLLRTGEQPIPGFGVNGELGITQRDNGTFQVTYNGMPLYYWIDDAAPGDTLGQGVNDVWFVVAP